MTTASTRKARLADVALPDFGMPATEPPLPASLYAERLDRLQARMAERGYDHLVVWADREHSANLAYLTGFDPRFEEAALVVGPSGDPAVLAGNECAGMAGAAPLPMQAGAVPRHEPAWPAAPRRAAAAARCSARKASGPRAEWASSAGRRMRAARRSRYPPLSWTSSGSSAAPEGWWRTPATSSSTRPTACASSTRWSSSRPSSGQLARRPRACGTCWPA